jgi:Sec-independent protein translocase protein TatA
MVLLAFLNLGPSEVALILVLLVVLFGADKAPALARRVGAMKAQLDSARSQVVDAFTTPQDRQDENLAAFEAKRERYVRAMDDAPYEELVKRAEALGLQTQGLDTLDLKAAIAARLAGEDKSEEPPA